jgi:YVTN family beta-propeller protein
MHRFLIDVALLAFAAPIAVAQSPVGHFNGRARLFNRDVPIELEIARADTGWRGDLTVPQLGVRDRPFSRVSIVGATVELVLAAPWNVTFAGTLSANGDTLAGRTRGRDSSAFSAVRGPDLTAQREAALGLPPLTPIGSRATATLSIPGSADFLAADGDAAWVTNGNQIQKLEHGRTDPVLNATVPRACGGMVTAFNSVWVMSCRELALYRVDRTTGQVITSVKTGAAEPRGELSVAAGAGSLWVLSDSTGVLSRIDPTTNAVTERIPVLSSSFAADFGFGSVWITNTAANSVQRVDPTSNKVVATIPVGPTPRFLAVGEGGVWTLNQGDGTVTRIDPATNRVAATIAVGVPGNGGDIAAGGGRVYVRAGFVLLSVIDPAMNRVVERFGPTSGSGGVRVAGNRVWVTAHDIKTVWVLEASRP